MKRPIAAIAVLLFALGTSAVAQEHPEHPKKGEAKQEHPEHPQAKGELTLDTLAEAITDYIETDTKLKGGAFLVLDPQSKTVLQLKLAKVHKDRLSGLGNGVYFACTDMEAADGTVYDLDFFMQQTEHGIHTTEVAIHKQGGKPRYNWKEENGTWRKVKI
jgi:hypothetical protein